MPYHMQLVLFLMCLRPAHQTAWVHHHLYMFTWFEIGDLEGYSVCSTLHLCPEMKISAFMMSLLSDPPCFRLVCRSSVNVSVCYCWFWNTSCLSACLPVFLSSLRVVSYAARLSQSQQCAADTEEKERRPSGLGHTVATTTRDAARTPLQTIITVRVGRNNDNSYGNVSPLCLQWRSFFPCAAPPPPLHLSLDPDLTLSSHLLR